MVSRHLPPALTLFVNIQQLAVVLIALGCVGARAQIPPDRLPPTGSIAQSGFPLATPYQEFSTYLSIAIAKAVSRGALKMSQQIAVSAYRSNQYEAGLDKTYGNSKPGFSPHSGWLAADVNARDIVPGKFVEWLEILDGEGLYVPFPWDPVHVEPRPLTPLFDARAQNANNLGRDTYSSQTRRLAAMKQMLSDDPETAPIAAALPSAIVENEEEARNAVGRFLDQFAPIMRETKSIRDKFSDTYKKTWAAKQLPGQYKSVPFALRRFDTAVESDISLLALAIEGASPRPASPMSNERISTRRIAKSAKSLLPSMRQLQAERDESQQRVSDLSNDAARFSGVRSAPESSLESRRGRVEAAPRECNDRCYDIKPTARPQEPEPRAAEAPRRVTGICIGMRCFDLSDKPKPKRPDAEDGTLRFINP